MGVGSALQRPRLAPAPQTDAPDLRSAGMKQNRNLVTGLPTVLKVLASYLVAILLLQGLAAAFALGAGPLHRHQSAPAATAARLFSHHDHFHASNQRHHHATGDGTVAADAAAQEAADAAALALTAALSLLAVQTPQARAANPSHVLHAAPPWFWHTVLTLPLMRPPSQG